MCYVCNCFAWTLDLVQRFITFALGCVMALVICCGLSVAIIAGIAYGYNYSMAEFLTFARSDITVYMRRGQFQDKPDLSDSSRRSGGDTYDLLMPNITSDYHEEIAPIDTNPLSNTWLKADETRRYAEKLTKYSPQGPVQERPVEAMMRPESLRYYKLTTPPPRLISIPPNRWAPTTIVQSPSEITMREFQPVEQLDPSTPDRDYDYVNFDQSEKATLVTTEQDTESVPPDVDSPDHDRTSYIVPMRSWAVTAGNPPIVIDYPTDDTDEDNIAYKPV